MVNRNSVSNGPTGVYPRSRSFRRRRESHKCMSGPGRMPTRRKGQPAERRSESTDRWRSVRDAAASADAVRARIGRSARYTAAAGIEEHFDRAGASAAAKAARFLDNRFVAPSKRYRIRQPATETRSRRVITRNRPKALNHCPTRSRGARDALKGIATTGHPVLSSRHREHRPARTRRDGGVA